MREIVFFCTKFLILPMLSIASYICTDGKQIFVSKYVQKECSENLDKTNIKWKKQEEKLKGEESIAESGKIFIRNLTYTTTEEDVRKLFEKYGKDIIVLLNHKSQQKFPLNGDSLCSSAYNFFHCKPVLAF